MKGESLPGKWELCRLRCSETHEKCFCDSHSLSKCPGSTKESVGFITIPLRRLSSSWMAVPREAEHSSPSVWEIPALANLPVGLSYNKQFYSKIIARFGLNFQGEKKQSWI